jgi:hypothetical protein
MDAFAWIAQYPVWSSIIALFAISIFSQLPGLVRAYVGYVAAFALAFFSALHAGNLLYFWAFTVGMLAAFVEIITKFPDEPLKSLGTTEALIYHAVNGGIAAFSLWVLVLFKVSSQTDLDKLKIVLAASLGSMAVMRSKLFNVKVGEEDISVGPEQIVKVFFRFMEESIGRVRALSRINFVTEVMNNLNFQNIRTHTIAMLDSVQTLSVERKTDLETKMSRISEAEPQEPQLKSYLLGFLLLDAMGEAFVRRLYQERKAEWLLAADKPSSVGEAGITRFVPSLFKSEPKYAYYFSYDTTMVAENLIARIGWSPEDAQRLFKEPKRGVLKGYRLDFSYAASDGTGRANIVPDANRAVEGVVYSVPTTALDFLITSEEGRRRAEVLVEVPGNNESTPCVTLVATDAVSGLFPTTDYVVELEKAMERYGYSQQYKDALSASAMEANLASREMAAGK